MKRMIRSCASWHKSTILRVHVRRMRCSYMVQCSSLVCDELSKIISATTQLSSLVMLWFTQHCTLHTVASKKRKHVEREREREWKKQHSQWVSQSDGDEDDNWPCSCLPHARNGLHANVQSSFFSLTHSVSLADCPFTITLQRIHLLSAGLLVLLERMQPSRAVHRRNCYLPADR